MPRLGDLSSEPGTQVYNFLKLNRRRYNGLWRIVMKTLRWMFVIGLFGWLAQAANAFEHGGGCCTDCGCKTCRLVCETKTIKVIRWGCECDDVCLPPKSCEGCTHCDGECCPSCDSCGCNKKPDTHIVWKEWTPGECGDVRSRKKLVKYEVTKVIPSFKWVVEKCESCGCASSCGSGCDACGGASSSAPSHPSNLPPSAPKAAGRKMNAGDNTADAMPSRPAVSPASFNEQSPPTNAAGNGSMWNLFKGSK